MLAGSVLDSWPCQGNIDKTREYGFVTRVSKHAIACRTTLWKSWFFLPGTGAAVDTSYGSILRFAVVLPHRVWGGGDIWQCLDKLDISCLRQRCQIADVREKVPSTPRSGVNMSSEQNATNMSLLPPQASAHISHLQDSTHSGDQVLGFSSAHGVDKTSLVPKTCHARQCPKNHQQQAARAANIGRIGRFPKPKASKPSTTSHTPMAEHTAIPAHPSILLLNSRPWLYELQERGRLSSRAYSDMQPRRDEERLYASWMSLRSLMCFSSFFQCVREMRMDSSFERCATRLGRGPGQRG